jgi:hypothetical protein
MTKGEVYTEDLVCRMWALFGKYASLYGYKPYNNYTCTNKIYTPI